MSDIGAFLIGFSIAVGLYWLACGFDAIGDGLKDIAKALHDEDVD